MSIEKLVISSSHNYEILPALLQAISEHPDLQAEHEQMSVSAFSIMPCYAAEDSANEWWESVQCYETMDELSQLLDAVSPDGMYFGEHHANTGAIGWWQS